MHLLLHFNLRLPKQPASAKPRIVHQQGQARLRSNTICHNRQLLFIRQIRREHSDFTSVLSGQLSSNRVQSILAARHQQQIVLHSKLSRKNHSKPARRSRNHRQSLSHCARSLNP